MEIKLGGKRVFISAGGAGMGRATVLAMHRLGAQVFTCDIDDEGLSTLPSGVTSYHCDVSDPDAVDAMMAQFLPDGLSESQPLCGSKMGGDRIYEDTGDGAWAGQYPSQWHCAG